MNYLLFNQTKFEWIFLSLIAFFVRNGKPLTSFCSSARQYSSAVSSCHAWSEPVLIHAFSFRRLVCSFAHCTVNFRGAKVNAFY